MLHFPRRVEAAFLGQVSPVPSEDKAGYQLTFKVSHEFSSASTKPCWVVHVKISTTSSD